MWADRCGSQELNQLLFRRGAHLNQHPVEVQATGDRLIRHTGGPRVILPRHLDSVGSIVLVGRVEDNGASVQIAFSGPDNQPAWHRYQMRPPWLGRWPPPPNDLRFSCGRPLGRRTDESLPLVPRPPAASAGLGGTFRARSPQRTMPGQWVEEPCQEPEPLGVRPERGAPKDHDADARGPPHEKAPDVALRTGRWRPTHAHLRVPARTLRTWQPGTCVTTRAPGSPRGPSAAPPRGSGLKPAHPRSVGISFRDRLTCT